MYELLKKRRFLSALSFLFSVPHCSLWTVTLLLCIIFSTQSPASIFVTLEAFSYRPYFLNPLVFLWPSGILPISRALFGRLIQYRAKQFQPGLTGHVFPPWYPLFLILQCPFSCSRRCCVQPRLHPREHGALPEVCRLRSQMGNAVSGLARMLPPKEKYLCLPSNCFYTSNSFKALLACISSEGSLLYPALFFS